MRSIARGLVVLLCWTAEVAAGQHAFMGRRLDDALRLLQRDGLPIVFSSEIVRPEMRVAAEPRATSALQQLDELLAPHGLKAEAGPGRTILIVRTGRHAMPGPVGHTRTALGADVASRPSDRSATATYVDRIIVRGEPARIQDAPSVLTLENGTLQAASSPLDSDGLEAVRAMPGVTALDDARTDFSVRGSPYRQIGTVIDGVSTRWLQHAVYGRYDAGSLTMFGSDVLERATLQAGAYPRLYDDTLGAQLELTLREGSRHATRLTGRAGGLSAGVVGEGPMAGGRGSWIAGLRNSYRSWPPRRLSQDDVGFAFADAHAKIVYDLSPTEQISVTALAGRSAAETADEPLVSALASGINRAALLTVGWRSTVGSQTVVRHRVFLVGQELESTLATGQLAGRSSNRSLGYRGEVLRSVFGGLFEAGAEVSRLSGARDGHGERNAWSRAAWTTNAAYVNFARTVRRLSFETGARASYATLMHQQAVTPWVAGAWQFKPGWTMNASAGASRQFPNLDAVLGAAEGSELVPERATHVDVGLAQQLSGFRWQVTLFTRAERDVLRGSVLEPRQLVSGFDSAHPVGYQNGLDGLTRGVELVVIRQNPARVSGWMSYAYAASRQSDASTGASFWSDTDRHHAFNAAGLFRIGRQASAGFVIRAASGVPMPAFVTPSDGEDVGGDPHYVARVGSYIRLDARVQRTFFSATHAVTLFGEVLNALNRRDAGIATRFIQSGSGEATGAATSSASRRVFGGIEVVLSR